MSAASSVPAPQRMTYREACKQAIRAAILADPRVFLMGEDVARYGGCYAVTKGLADELGEDRIRDTPLSEGGYVGAGIGAAIAGMRPIVEIMTVNFSLLALDQIVNNAATIPHMSGGQFAVPLVIRMATGAGRQLAAQHSHSLEGWYAHIPGLKVLAPATHRGRALHAAAGAGRSEPGADLRACHAVQPRGRCWTRRSPSVDIASAKIRRPGRDVTLVTYGGTLFKTLEAAETLRPEGIEAEVIDLRVLRPLDMPTVLASVARTRRVVIVDEGWRSGSLSAEIAARIVEDGVLRPRCADPPRLLARGADPLCRASRAGGAAAGAGHRCRGARTGDAAHDRLPHALARRRHGGRHAGRMAGEAGRSGEARRRRRGGGDAEGRDRDRDLQRRRRVGTGRAGWRRVCRSVRCWRGSMAAAGASVAASAGRRRLPTPAAPPATPNPPSASTADPRAVSPEPQRRVSPAARRLAAARGIDISGVAGTGLGGAITVADVEAAAPTTGCAPAPPRRDRLRSAPRCARPSPRR